ncbi:LutB/LldF family L-lactate oxidation iron-sulfur protein [Listeria sp. PSOL-1]|uniref:LutB/LldF family L-lactate oxidation iron-sulfur protein n=1 Tax=Listeria sp. PSOL-1 TaxID=1844999 RepID=UPI0013D8526C|nr:LutB/LldF family L-lactate oxidation iron-sulfur protein [Listeria sp. PSOL-1]
MGIQTDTRRFKLRENDGIQDLEMRRAVAKAQDGLRVRRDEAAEQLGDWEKWRDLGEQIRQHTLQHLDYYLYQLSENVSKKGGHVFFAETKEEASAYIEEVIKKKAATKVVKAKSMVTEEINLNHVLEASGCEVLETDLGEYILQEDESDPPSHIVAPALHKNRTQIRKVFHEKLGYTGDDDATNLARFARQILRKKFMEAEVGITGCNFAIANTGSINLVTNEGNADLCASLPDTHIAVMGMERIVPTMEEMEVMDNLLCRSAVGQKLTSYISVYTGAKNEQEEDGPSEFHLVIVDNGRSDILGGTFKQILQCIRCGACMNVCPVYRTIGGHAYGSIYPGPVGAVLSPLLGGYANYKELPFASSLCGACTDVCPVKIPLHELLIWHREHIIEKEKKYNQSEHLQMKLIGMGTSSPFLFKAALSMAHGLVRPLTKEDRVVKGPGLIKGWTNARDLPVPPKKKDDFRTWYKAHKAGEIK